MPKIFISTTSFSQYSNKPIEIIKNNSFDYSVNEEGRKLSPDEIVSNLNDCVGVIAGTEEYSSQILNQLPNLKVISRLGVGIDNINLDVAKQNKIKICTTNSSPAVAVSELVIGHIIDLLRYITVTNNLLNEGIWEKKMGSLLSGKTLGIIGLGKIGKELVKICEGFNLKILAYDVVSDNDFAEKYQIKYCDLNELLSLSDIVTIHLNLSPDTKHLLDQEKLNLMKKNAIIINASRGGIIDEEALYNVLSSNNIAGVGLDVFEKEPYYGKIKNLKNVILTPHIGAYAKEIRMKMEIEAVENIVEILNEKK